MKKLLLPISIAAIAAVVYSCNSNKADATSNNDSLRTDTPSVVNAVDNNPANDKVVLNSDSAVKNTNHENGAPAEAKETNTKGSTEKGNTNNLSNGKMEVVKHGSDNQAKLDSIKNAKQKQRGN